PLLSDFQSPALPTELPCSELQLEYRAYEVGIATQDLLDIVKTTLSTQYLSERSPGALVRSDQDMKKPRPGVEDLLQCTRPGEFWHNLCIDGGLVRQRRRIAATGYREGFGGQIRATQGIVNALTSKGFEEPSRISQHECTPTYQRCAR